MCRSCLPSRSARSRPLSSTTETSRGQALALFALSLSALLLAAALAFDVGAMLLEKRDQQNAADAAALAGVRYVLDDGTQARNAALDVATANGFTTDMSGTPSVVVNIPPTSGGYATWPGAVEVRIRNELPPIFGGILSIFNGGTVPDWGVGSRAVAAIFDDIAGPFAILALDPLGCEAILVSGNGMLDSQGNIQVNSTCESGAFKRQGGGTVEVAADNSCNVVGDIQDGGGQGYFQCAMNEGAPEVPDPLAELPAPPMPGAPAPVVLLTGTNSIPAACPGGSNPATEAAPAVCQFPSSYSGTVWRLYPGLYPGGIKLQAGTFYFEPGIYYLAGGGLDITGNGTVSMSVDGGTTLDHGVLFYNTQIPGSPLGPVSLNGATADIDLYPLKLDTIWDGLVVFQDCPDRTVDCGMGPETLGDDVTINGSTSDMSVRGTIYVPEGDVKVNGSAGALTLDQVIAWRFKVNGSTGSIIRALDDDGFVKLFSAAGLVE